MKFSKRIIKSINEGVAKGLNFSLDNEEDSDEMYTKNNATKKLQNLDKQVEKEYYSRKLQEMLPDPSVIDKFFINNAQEWYEKYAAQYNPHLDNMKFSDFIENIIFVIYREERKNEKFCINLNWIDTSDVTSMKRTLNGVKNIDISEWDVSNVTTMYGLFEDSTFNGDLSKWDVSNVVNMKRMFANSSFNNNSISNWDVSNVKYIENMFANSNFNQDITNWDLSNAEKNKGIVLDIDLTFKGMFSSGKIEAKNLPALVSNCLVRL